MSRSKFGVAAVAVSSVFLLSGCLNFDANVNVDSDGLASGDFTFTISEQAAGFLGISSSEALTESFTDGELEGGEEFVGSVDCRAADVEGAVGTTCSFKDAEFTEEGELWWITTTEDSVVFRSQIEGESEEEASDEFLPDFDAGLGDAGYTINVTMPGKITSIEGDFVEQTSDTTAVIETSLTDSADVEIVSEKSSGGGVPVVLFGVAGGLVLGGAAAFYFARRASSDGAAAAGQGEPMQGEPMQGEPAPGAFFDGAPADGAPMENGSPVEGATGDGSSTEQNRQPGSTWEY